MTDQPALFPAHDTDTVCPVRGCQAIRFAGQDRVVTCMHDLRIAAVDFGKRPKNCLNVWDPSTADIGF